MEYERIEKPFSSSLQVGGFSPRKLRSMLLGMEKKRKEEEEEEDVFKDVNVVSSGPEPHHNAATSSIRSLEEDDDGDDGAAALSAFEFHKAAPAAAQRPPFSKPAPSKWDDAHKWLASSNPNRRSSKEKRSGGGGGGHRSRTSAMKVVMEDVDTKRVDPSEIKREIGEHKAVVTAAAATDSVKDFCLVSDCDAKPAIGVESLATDSAVSLSRHESSITVESDTTFLQPPSTIRSVSMRDMGTEMTPLASQEPSRTGTPVRATTPIRSPSSSRPSTPRRSVPTSTLTERGDFNEAHNGRELSEKELQMKTRREIMILGTQLGKANIAAWASKDEEEHEASTSFQNVLVNQPANSVIRTRTASWEEAEKAKYMARFKQEEIKIQAWENHQKAKTEAELRKIEVEVERMRARAHEKLTEKLAAARHKAEERRADAEAKRDQQVARTTQRVEYIRNTGHIPSSFSCWAWCS
ncbi:uncharacterized protein M6B38_122120 [Iris pallida]|uniref:Remorin C-terminal domain-containing protein n=1 Tax=Iris pallida TaxID=29817 RepID=A0AAX6H9Q3_IRIPA|nr:uncharacterized protein M6B38_122120 [Iris pallida]